MAEWTSDGRTLPPFSADGNTVASYVTAGFEAYARVLNPVRGPGDQRRPWSDFLPSGTTLAADAQFHDLRSGSKAGAPMTGTVDDAVLGVLLEALVADDRAQVIVAQWEGYADAELPSGADAQVLPPDRRSGIWALSAAELRARTRTPMRFWDPQGNWAVGNDIYARSVFIGADRELIEALVADPRLEALRVEPSDPVGVEDL